MKRGLILGGVLLWVGLTAFLAADAYYVQQINTQLTEQTQLLKDVLATEKQHSDGIARVNAVCSDVVIRLAKGLGIDVDLQPLLTTAVMSRSAASHVKVEGGVGGGDETGE